MLTVPPTRSRRRRPSDEAGMIMMEAVVVLAVMMVVVAMFADSLSSLINSSQRVQALVTNEQTVRFGLDQLERDLRAANPLDPLTTTAAYANEIRFEIGPTPGTHTYLRWFYDTTPTSPTYESLIRQIMAGPTGATVLSQTVVVTRARNIETSTAMFTYDDAHNDDLVSLNPATPANVANCAIAVHIQIDANSQPGPQPFSENIDVELRNRLPGGIVGCPA